MKRLRALGLAVTLTLVGSACEVEGEVDEDVSDDTLSVEDDRGIDVEVSEETERDVREAGRAVGEAVGEGVEAAGAVVEEAGQEIQRGVSDAGDDSL